MTYESFVGTRTDEESFGVNHLIFSNTLIKFPDP